MYSGVWGGYCRDQCEIQITLRVKKNHMYIGGVTGCEPHKRILGFSADTDQTQVNTVTYI